MVLAGAPTLPLQPTGLIFLPVAVIAVTSVGQQIGAERANRRGRCKAPFLLLGHRTTPCGGRPAPRLLTAALESQVAPHSDKVSKE